MLVAFAAPGDGPTAADASADVPAWSTPGETLPSCLPRPSTACCLLVRTCCRLSCSVSSWMSWRGPEKCRSKAKPTSSEPAQNKVPAVMTESYAKNERQDKVVSGRLRYGGYLPAQFLSKFQQGITTGQSTGNADRTHFKSYAHETLRCLLPTPRSQPVQTASLSDITSSPHLQSPLLPAVAPPLASAHHPVCCCWGAAAQPAHCSGPEEGQKQAAAHRC